jgi:hypothetical protein
MVACKNCAKKMPADVPVPVPVKPPKKCCNAFLNSNILDASKIISNLLPSTNNDKSKDENNDMPKDINNKLINYVSKTIMFLVMLTIMNLFGLFNIKKINSAYSNIYLKLMKNIS